MIYFGNEIINKNMTHEILSDIINLIIKYDITLLKILKTMNGDKNIHI